MNKQLFLIVFASMQLMQAINATRTLQSLSPASSWAEFTDTKIPKRKELIDHYVADCAHFAAQNSLIPPHQVNSKTIRIATYNIHFWCNPYLSPYKVDLNLAPYSPDDVAKGFERVVDVVKSINADVICLQEVLLFDAIKIKSTFESLGYLYQSYVHEAQWDHSFGGLILSKYPFAKAPENKIFDAHACRKSRSDQINCLQKANVLLPNDKTVTVYAAHFDWSDETDSIRYEEIDEVIADIKKNNAANCLVCGDFNAVRMHDYQYSINGNLVWDLMNRDNLARTQMLTPIKALRLFELNNFRDCFAQAQIAMPKFSVWNGTVVDFIYVNNSWNLPIDGCYFYYSALSDHLPVIMDVNVN